MINLSFKGVTNKTYLMLDAVELEFHDGKFMVVCPEAVSYFVDTFTDDNEDEDMELSIEFTWKCCSIMKFNPEGYFEVSRYFTDYDLPLFNDLVDVTTLFFPEDTVDDYILEIESVTAFS